MDDSSPPQRHAPPHIRLNSGSGGDLLDAHSSPESESQQRMQASRQPSTRSLIPQTRPGTASTLRQQTSGASVYQSGAPAESAEQLLLPPRKSKSRRFRDDDSPLPSGVNSRRTSWSSGSDGSRDSRYGGPFMSPFEDSRAPSRSGSDDEGVNTQTVSEKYNILPSAGLLLFPEDVEKDDWLHTPDPNERDRMNCGDLFSKRGLVNVGGLLFITLGVLCLFIGYPIITFATSLLHPGGLSCSEDPNCLNQNAPLFSNVRKGLIDPDTPSSAKYKTDSQGRTLQLAFSDEFNDDGRTFYEGDDPYYQGVDIWYGVTQDLEWYDPDAVYTNGGALNIRMDAFKNHNLNYRSGMLQSWNMLCFKSGMLEASISLPGAGSVEGFWPGFWSMGNLGRPGYAATTDGMWPYSYWDTCDAGITRNQSQVDGINWLPGMRLPGCVCDAEDTPSAGTARSAPEIDAIEASNYNLNNIAGNMVGSASQSVQIAPFDIWYRPDTEFQEIYDYTLTSINAYQGGPYQQAVSALTTLSNDWYDGNAYQIYGYDYEPGADGYITWWVGDQPTWMTTATSMRPNGNVGQRLVPEEPMSLIVNFGISNGFSFINVPEIEALLPATMRIDYIRIYQDEDGEMTCDPEGYPTTSYIAAHPKAYQNPNVTHWADAGYVTPQNSYVDSCTASSKSKMKRSEKRALRRRQEAARLQKRSTSWWPWS